MALPVAMPPGEVDLQKLWTGLVEAVGRASPFVKGYFMEAHPVSFIKNVLTIGFDPEFADHLKLVDNSKNHAVVQTKLAELGYPHSQVRFIKAERPAQEKADVPPPTPAPPSSSPPTAVAKPEPPRPSPEPTSFKKEDFKNDPLIQKALEIFKGQIVEVRS